MEQLSAHWMIKLPVLYPAGFTIFLIWKVSKYIPYRDNVNLVEVFNAMEKAGGSLPDEKDNNAVKKYFEKVYPDMDFERVYASDMKKMVKWFDILKKNKIEIKLSEVPEEEEAEEVEEVKEEDVVKKSTGKKSSGEEKSHCSRRERRNSCSEKSSPKKKAA